MPDVFLVFFELSGRSARFRSEGYAGGFVTCIVSSKNIRQSIEIAENALIADEYEIVDIEKAMRFDPEDWQHDAVIPDLVKATSEDGETRYSEFDVWGH